MQSATRAEAERLLGIAEKLLQTRDLNGSREFAILAQETEPLLEGSDQILAIVDVLLAADNRPNAASHQPDWYAVLQVDRRTSDLDLIKRHYRRLALLLHPDKSRFAFADHAFKLVADAWAVLSDPIKKSNYDKELSFFSRVDLSVPGWIQQDKLPVRRTGPGPGPGPGPSSRNNNNNNHHHNLGGYDSINISMSNNTPASAARTEIAAEENANSNTRQRRSGTIWTACPYCYRLYEYPRVYEGCCLRCQNCERSFHGISIPSLPPLVPGQDAYYCCWGFFPMGFVVGSVGSAEKEPASAMTVAAAATAPPQPASALPNWMPAATAVQQNGGNATAAAPVVTPARGATRGVSNGVALGTGSGPKKRGRPRKYPLPS